MSLINDALKRASQSDKKRAAASTPTPPETPGQPVPAPQKRSRTMPWIIGTVVVLTILGQAVWFFWHAFNSTNAEVVPLPAPVQLQEAPTPGATPVPVQPIVHAQENATAAPAAPAAPAPVSTPVAPPAPPAAPSWPALTLKGIFYSKSNPRALINDQTVTPGETIDGVLVSSIESDRVIVKWNGQSKELMMEAP